MTAFDPQKTKPRRVQVHLWVDREAHAAIAELSRRNKITISECIRQAINYAIKHAKPEEL